MAVISEEGRGKESIKTKAKMHGLLYHLYSLFLLKKYSFLRISVCVARQEG
jgi:hypothetical protein